MTITIDQTIAHSLKNIKYFLSESYKKKILTEYLFFTLDITCPIPS